MIKYFSKNGETQYSEKYKHLATHEVDMPEPETPENHTAIAKLDLDTLEGYWEYREIKKTEEELMEELRKDLDESVMELSIAMSMLGVNTDV